MLRSSIYFRLREFSLGMAGLKSAPLNTMMKSKIPRKAPWGDDPGNHFLEDIDPLYLMYIERSVR